MIERTNYIIEYGSKTNIVYENDKIIAKTIASIPDSALHAIHSLNGSVSNHWYKEIDGKIYVIIKEVEDAPIS